MEEGEEEGRQRVWGVWREEWWRVGREKKEEGEGEETE